MKNIKNYLILALSIGFCTSFQTFTMEKEVKSTGRSGSMEEQSIGTPDTSSESGMEEKTKQMLATRISKLNDINEMINRALKDRDLSIKERKELEQLKEYTKRIITKTTDMYLGIIPVNILSINHQINIILNQWAQTATASESSSY
jgi:hypothetical protein